MKGSNLKRISILSLTALMIITTTVKAEEKNQEDPTKIVTKLGVAYVDETFGVSGSVGLSDSKKINARVSDKGDEYRIGGSWLFDIGIVNFNYSKTTYNDTDYKHNYSIGTFVPLSVFGIEPMGVKIFPMAGYSYNDGEIQVEDKKTASVEDFAITSVSNNGGYLGVFALKQLSENFTLMGFGGGSKGSDDYSGSWAGVGLSYKYNKENSFKTFATTVDDDFGSENKLGFVYTYEFN